MTEHSSVDTVAIKQSFAAGLTSIEAANSHEFLRAVFAAYDAGQLFSITRADVDPAIYGTKVSRIEHASETRGWITLDHTVRHDDGAAQIVFTSGTEGQPKAIVLTHRNLGNVVTRLNDVMETTSEIREYVGVPVTYSFGLGRARAVSAVGGALYVPDRFDPVEIRQMLEAGEINAISAVPSLLRLILAAPDSIGDAGRRVRWIEIGSQYMTADEKAQLQGIFPNARIVQHYGMTEASRTTFLVISGETDPDRLESVGTAGENIRIASDGAIEIRGDHLASFKVDPGGEMTPLAGPDGWFVSSDRGALRDGMLFFLGRLDDQMNLGGIKVAAEALEARIAELVPNVQGHFAVTSVQDAMRGEAVLLAVEPPADALRDLVVAATVQALKEKGVAAGGSLQNISLDALPRTATGKIRRAALRDIDRGAPSRSNTPAPQADLTEEAAKVASLWTRILGDVQIGPDANFYESGGDSLSGLQVGLVMESAGINRAAINATFEGASLQDVAALAYGDTKDLSGVTDRPALPAPTQLSWSLTLTRSMVVLAVMLSHWGPGLMNALGLPQTMFISYTRLGTPGFAFVFGLGVGLYMLPEMARNPKAVYHRADRALLLVASGAVVMGLIYFVYFLQLGRPMNWLTGSNALYSVLIYYTIMLATTRLWLPLIARLRAPVTGLLLLSCAMWGMWQIMRAGVIPSQQYVSPLEVLRLMFGAGGYNVFKLGTMTAAGAAVGYWIFTQDSLDTVKKRLLLIGGFGAVFCAAAALQAHGTILLTQSTKMHTSLMGLGYYGSLCLLFFGVFLLILPAWAKMRGLLRTALRLALTFGGLALPIYVLHQFVIPIFKILEIQGLPKVVALGIPMGAFILAIAYLGRRVYRMYGA